uniref:G-protein coupled receptors family 1 profile domain-containing protein n=1 Tax=Plectus sambesii TaxID=2011161 RepID=A0A914WM90_9BILA
MTEPVMQCIDLDASFAANLVPNDSVNASRQLTNWASFSFAINGLTTLGCVLFGVIGNALLVVQIKGGKRNQRFNRRLRLHLIALCAWNSLLLLSCFASHCVLSLINDGMIPIRGTAAYLLFTAQPIGSLAVTAAVWQIGAITVERYLAVVHPLQELLLKEKLPVKWIILVVAVVAVVLNIPSSALERQIIPCFLASVNENDTHPQLLQQSTSVMIILTSIRDDPVYRLWSNFVLDLIFRCPTPMIVIGVMTIRTVHCYCYSGRMRAEAFDITKQQRVRSNAAVVVLTILNAKMILCNGPYMFNTLVELIATYASTTANDNHPSASFDEFLLSLYMTDMANLLVVVSSATDWLLFYQWKGANGRTRPRSESLKLKSLVINRDEGRVLTELAERLNCEEVGCGLMLVLAQHNSAVGAHFGAAHTTLDKSSALLNHGRLVGKFLVDLMTKFADKRTHLVEMRDTCRKVGAAHRKKKITLKANDMKLAKSYLTDLILSHASDIEIAKPCVSKLLSFMLHEIRAGALCQQADETKLAFVRQIIIAPDAKLLKNWSPATKESSAQPLLSAGDDN